VLLPPCHRFTNPLPNVGARKLFAVSRPVLNTDCAKELIAREAGPPYTENLKAHNNNKRVAQSDREQEEEEER
jgi:hypothetical protein